ncbi:hypothetical protein ACFSHR_14515 [Azotobacter chroococcum]
MARIVQTNKPLSVNPLRVSQPMGAALAFLGLARSLPWNTAPRAARRSARCSSPATSASPSRCRPPRSTCSAACSAATSGCRKAWPQ